MKPDYSFNINKKVEKYIDSNKMLRHGDSVIVGLSGGADSVCLFLLLNSLKEKYGISLHAVHINHCIRGESADRDELFVKELCEKVKVPFKAYHVDVPQIAKEKGITVEEAGRNVRYECFENYASELYTDIKIAVAHHMNDQAETVLFNMVRGSGIKGIGGMSPVSKRTVGESIVTVIRPLLCLSRDEIIKYLDYNHQDYCIDETNLDNDYSRNMIRNEVVPGLCDIQPKSSEHIASMADDAREAMEYIEDITEKLYYDAVTIEMEEDGKASYCINISKIKNEKPFIVKQLIIYVLRKMIATYKDITKIHIEDIYSLISKGKGKHVMIPYGIDAIREKEIIRIIKK